MGGICDLPSFFAKRKKGNLLVFSILIAPTRLNPTYERGTSFMLSIKVKGSFYRTYTFLCGYNIHSNLNHYYHKCDVVIIICNVITIKCNVGIN